MLADLLIRALKYALFVDDPLTQDRVCEMGKAFPKHGISMNFASAMWNVVSLLNRVRDGGVGGDFVESGVWRGANGILASKWLEAANDLKGPRTPNGRLVWQV